MILGVILSLALVTIAFYHFLSPKVVVENVSDKQYEELKIVLPESGLSFGPIKPGESNTIYHSQQKRNGQVEYSLIYEGKIVAEGTQYYSKDHELGSKLQFVISGKHNVQIIDQ